MEIPQDIIDNVIAAVGDDNRLLKQCSLVSSSFLLPSRKQLFSRIFLRSDQTCQGIHQLLVQNPVIQSSVRTITLTDEETMMVSWGTENPMWMNGTSLLAILRLPFCCLECFSIIVSQGDWAWNPWNWNSFSSELKDALSNIMHSTTLKTLSLKGITKVPITIFLHIVHLTTLELHSLSLSDFGSENSSSLTRAASKGVAPMASHTVIDRCVWRFFRRQYVRGTTRRFPSSAYFSPIQDREGLTKSIFLPFMCRLRHFEICINFGSATVDDFDFLSVFMGSICISLTSPATLEHLEFSICFHGSSSNDFNTYTFYQNLRDADVWSHLDSITSHPTGSRLQRVDININYSFHYDFCGVEPDKDEVLKAVLDGLPLLRTKDILFVKAALTD